TFWKNRVGGVGPHEADVGSALDDGEDLRGARVLVGSVEATVRARSQCGPGDAEGVESLGRRPSDLGHCWSDAWCCVLRRDVVEESPEEEVLGDYSFRVFAYKAVDDYCNTKRRDHH
ncbi:uncharacterized protein A4U43_C06F960, partial [Asparagus officinalis]